MAALDLGFLPGADGRDVAGIVDGAQKGEIDFIYLLGADEFDVAHLGRAFVVYQGSHGDAGAHHADVILPGAAYTEKDGLYVNFEGRVQRAERAAFPPGEAQRRLDHPARAVRCAGHKLPYDNRAALRAAMVKQTPAFRRIWARRRCMPTPRLRPGTGIGAAGPLDTHQPLDRTRSPIITSPTRSRGRARPWRKCSREFVTGASKMAAE